MVTEEQFLMKYEELREALSHVCELPERTLNLLLIFIHRNGGALSPHYREEFPGLSDEVIAEAELAYRTIHNLRQATS